VSLPRTFARRLGERLAIHDTDVQVVRAGAAPLRIDRWAQVAPVERGVREQWEAFLRAPRWFWIAGGPPAFHAVLITLDSDPLAPLRVRPGRTTDPYEGYNDQVTVLGVRMPDRALVSPFPSERRWFRSLVEVLRGCDGRALFSLLEAPEWRPLRSQRGLELAHHQSGFGMALASFSGFAAELVAAGRRVRALAEAEGVAICAEARRRERRIFRAARTMLLSALDRDAVQHLRKSGAPLTPAAYNYLVTGGEGRHWRAQAIAEYPAVVAQLVSIDLGPLFGAEEAEWNAVRDASRRRHGLPVQADVIEGVDAGTRLARLLARHFQVREGTVRRLRRLTRSRLRGSQLHNLEALVSMLDLAPYEYWPRTRLEGVAAAVLAPGLHALAAAFDGIDGAAARAFREGSLREFLALAGKRGWIASAQRLGKQSMSQSFTTPGAAFRSLQLALAAAGVDVGAPVLALARRPVEALLRWRREWEAALSRYDLLRLSAVDTSPLGTIAWPPLVERFTAGAREVVPLTDTDALREDGAALGHCAATRAIACIAGRTHLFSLRAPDGLRCSTLELELEVHPARDVQPRIVQHRSARNGAPPEACRRAAGALLARLDALPPEHFAPLEAALQQRQRRFGALDAAQVAADTRRHWYALRESLPRDVLAVIDAGRLRAAWQ